MNLSKYKMWRALLHRVIEKQQAKIVILCVNMRSESTKSWRTLIHSMITKQGV